MELTTVASSTSSNLQDPISNRLPNDVFLLLFNHLTSNEILESAAINRSWRRRILGSPSIFSSLLLNEIEDYGRYGPDEDGIYNPAELEGFANTTIKRILRYAMLSHHRLKEVHLVIHSFHQDFEFCRHGWSSCKLSVIFNILAFSSQSLKVLTLNIDSSVYPEDPEFADRVSYLMSIIENLTQFKALQSVTISAHDFLNLSSGSPLAKSFRIGGDQRFRWMDLSEEQPDEGFGFDRIFQLATDFTGEGLRTIGCRVENEGFGVQSDTLQELEKSRETLEKIDLEMDSEADLTPAVLDFVFNCRNLVDLSLLVTGTVMEDLQQVVQVPENHFSKLKKLVIRTGFGCRLIVDGNFFDWASSNKTLEELRLHGVNPPISIDPQPFESFLGSSGVFLVSLHLEHGYLTSEATPTQFQLPNLQRLRIRGNLKLINLFTKASYECLRDLELGLAQEELNHPEVLRMLESCRTSLEKVSLTDFGNYSPNRSEEDLLKFKENMVGKISPFFSLPKLDALSLNVGDVSIVKFYSGIDYPNLSKVLTAREVSYEPLFSLGRARRESTLDSA